MTESKVFTDPDLKLAALAAQLGLPSHQASKLINEKFGKSYNDFCERLPGAGIYREDESHGL